MRRFALRQTESLFTLKISSVLNSARQENEFMVPVFSKTKNPQFLFSILHLISMDCILNLPE